MQACSVVRLQDCAGSFMGYDVIVHHANLSEEENKNIRPIINDETAPTIRMCFGVSTRVYDLFNVLKETRISYFRKSEALEVSKKIEACIDEIREVSQNANC